MEWFTLHSSFVVQIYPIDVRECFWTSRGNFLPDSVIAPNLSESVWCSIPLIDDLNSPMPCVFCEAHSLSFPLLSLIFHAVLWSKRVKQEPRMHIFHLHLKRRSHASCYSWPPDCWISCHIQLVQSCLLAFNENHICNSLEGTWMHLRIKYS